MTLTITLVNQHGVWQSSDQRISDPKTNAPLDDFSVKHVAFRCRDGSALLTYGGAGSVKPYGRTDYVPLSEWIAKSIRGESYTLDETAIQIRERASEDLGELLHRHKILHMFSMGAFLNGVPWVVQIRNFSVPAPFEIGPIEREFRTLAQKVSVGSGTVVPWPFFVSDSDMALLLRVCTKRPRQPKEFSDLLGAVNLRTAQSSRSGGTVSANCVTTYLPPNGDSMQTYRHNAVAGSPPLITPLLLYGIDMTEQMKLLLQRPLGAKITSEDANRAGEESVIRRNLLKTGKRRAI